MSAKRTHRNLSTYLLLPERVKDKLMTTITIMITITVTATITVAVAVAVAVVVTITITITKITINNVLGLIMWSLIRSVITRVIHKIDGC